MKIVLKKCLPGDVDAKPLLLALSAELFRITGNDGTKSFSEDDFRVEGSAFFVAMRGEEPIGCGGLRPLTSDVCEVKRMYAKYAGQGIGSALLQRLECQAIQSGFKEIWLETRKINENAVKFYLHSGYQVQPNYGKYIGKQEAICFVKIL